MEKVSRTVSSRVAALGQMALMAAVVATCCYWPIGIAAAAVFAAFGVSVDSFVTFGGVLDRVSGMAVLWLFFFAPSLAYAAAVFPWDD